MKRPPLLQETRFKGLGIWHNFVTIVAGSALGDTKPVSIGFFFGCGFQFGGGGKEFGNLPRC